MRACMRCYGLQAMFLFMLYFSTSVALGQPNMVKLSGTLVHFDNETAIEDNSEFHDLRIAPATRLGDSYRATFSITLPLTQPGYFRIGRNILYLSPGDRLQMILDHEDAAKAVFSGKGAGANKYLAGIPFPKAGSFLNAGQNASAAPAQTINRVLQLAAERKRVLLAVKDVSHEFLLLEAARIRADLLNSLFFGKYYPPSNLDEAQQEVYARSFDSLAQTIIPKYATGFANASFLQLAAYRGICHLLVKQPGDSLAIYQMRDWLVAQRLRNKMQAVNDKQELLSFKTEINSIATTQYRDTLLTAWSALMAYGRGDSATDFRAADVNGNTVALSAFKGKIIYIDIWATWCGPCIEEMPAFEKLAAQFREDTNMVFVSLSIDHSPELWRRFLLKRGMGGIQWRADRSALSAYRIISVPRTVIINRNFKIEFMEGPLPGSQDIAATLEKLLRKAN